jgi:hypothetical protein
LILINVGKNFNLYPIIVLAWILSEMLALPHINIVGHYSFDLAKEILSGKLRPLQPMDKKLFGKKR